MNECSPETTGCTDLPVTGFTSLDLIVVAVLLVSAGVVCWLSIWRANR